MWHRGPLLWLGISPFEEQLFLLRFIREFLERTSSNFAGSMEKDAQVKGANFVHRFYHIPCVAFSPFSGNVGCFTVTACFQIAGKRLRMLCHLSRAWTISNIALVMIGTPSRYRSVLLRLLSLWSQVFLLGRLYFSTLHTLRLLQCPTF